MDNYQALENILKALDKSPDVTVSDVVYLIEKRQEELEQEPPAEEYDYG